MVRRSIALTRVRSRLRYVVTRCVARAAAATRATAPFAKLHAQALRWLPAMRQRDRQVWVAVGQQLQQRVHAPALVDQKQFVFVGAAAAGAAAAATAYR